MIENGAYGERMARYLTFERATPACEAGFRRVRISCHQASRTQMVSPT
jgi:hypothetical protein